MSETDSQNIEKIAARLRRQSTQNSIMVSVHAHQEMVADDISYEMIREALLDVHVVENYPKHKRGPCCLVCGGMRDGRFVHVARQLLWRLLLLLRRMCPNRISGSLHSREEKDHEM